MTYELEKTCCFSGHRIISKQFDKNEIEKTVNELINKGYNTFLVGMAIGFDTECFKIIEKLKQNKNLKLIACVPCKSQDENYNAQQKAEYQKMLAAADEIVYVSEEYYIGCMQMRNRYMVDNSSILITYLRRKNGGTFNTVKYASQQEKTIIYL